MLFGGVLGSLRESLGVFGWYFGMWTLLWESLGVTWGFSPCRIEPCWSLPTILAQHWNARFFSTWSFWDIKIPKPPHKNFLKIIGLSHFWHLLGSSERYYLYQLLLITLYCYGELVQHWIWSCQIVKVVVLWEKGSSVYGTTSKGALYPFTVAWVTRPERPKGAKDEVNQARRAQSRPEGPQPRSWGPEGPYTSSVS